MALKGNKGEWSELYVLFKLLAEKKMHAGDGELKKLDVYYPVLNVIRSELNRIMEYCINNDVVLITEDGEEVVRVSTSDFMEQSKSLFSYIQRGSKENGAFEIPSINDFLKKIKCEKIKAKSMDKSDIHVVIHDYHTGMTPKLGFSIKSDAGSSPTLLNASNATTFVYEVVGNSLDDKMMDEINAISSRRKMQDRINAIVGRGGKLKFDHVLNPTFEGNLRMIDSCLPKILGWMIADSYLVRDMNINNAVERIKKSNPLGYNMTEGHDYYGYKLKSLMVCSALGMLPATPWNGRYDATGGYIVVKEDGNVICFHLYDKNLLEDYLFNNTKFETPKSERYEIGSVYKFDGKYFFNLSLQIRFK